MPIKIISKWKRNDRDLTLRISENMEGLRGTLFENGKKWCTAMFYERDRDNTEYRVMEYFGFDYQNSHEIGKSVN